MSGRLYSKRMQDIAKKRAAVRRPRNRPKSFKTEEAAKKWAEANKIAKFTLKKLKRKIVVVKE